MTSKAESLVSNVTRMVPCSIGSRMSIDALVCYIEELERKAAAYDNLDATAESMCRMSVGELQRKLADFDAKFRRDD